MDFVQGPLQDIGASVVLYPDPPLSDEELRQLVRSYRRLRTATPTTLSREVRLRNPLPPLTGVKVAISISASPELAPDFAHVSARWAGSLSHGVALPHMDATIGFLILSLVRSGAALTYGGWQDSGYTAFLAAQISRYSRTKVDASDLFLTYLTKEARRYASGEELALKPTEIDVVRPRGHTPCISEQANNSLDYSEMRYRMAQSTDARVLIGGRQLPKPKDQDGFRGRFPGIAEEAFFHLSQGKPIYVAGAFLGAAGDVALALKNELAGLPTDAEWRKEPPKLLPDKDGKLEEWHYDRLCGEHDNHVEPVWNAPKTLDELWTTLAAFGRGVFWDVGFPRIWPENGLSDDDNHRLLNSVQPDEISALIMKGLRALELKKREAAAPLKAGLFHGSVADAIDVEAYGILMLGDAPLRGADAELNSRLNGRLETWIKTDGDRREQVIRISSDTLFGDFVLIHAVDKAKDLEALRIRPETVIENHVRAALQTFWDVAKEEKIRSLAIVPMGATLHLRLEDSAQIIVDVLKHHPTLESLVICESNSLRYERIRRHFTALKQEQKLKRETLQEQLRQELSADQRRILEGQLEESWRNELSYTVPALPSLPRSSKPPLYLEFEEKASSGEDKQVEQVAFGPNSKAAISRESCAVKWEELGSEFGGSDAPDFKQHDRLGVKLASMVLTRGVVSAIEQNQSSPWELMVDPLCSNIPFELLRIGNWRPALDGGIRRGLLMKDIPEPKPYPSKSRFRLLMIADPTNNLVGARGEAAAIIKDLTEQFGGPDCVPCIDIISLIGASNATKQRVLDEVASGKYDFIHYAGHGQHFPEDLDESGLVFKDGILSVNELERALARADAGSSDSTRHAPALVFLNACLAARMQHGALIPQAGLAQAILKSGVRAFIGNRWKVGDESACVFGTSVYRELVEGIALGDAVQNARNLVYQMDSPERRDWANFQLYGWAYLQL